MSETIHPRRTTTSAALERHFATLAEQRRHHLPELVRLAPSLAWRRPADGQWSAGEWLEHIWRTIRVQRILTQMYVPVASKFAALFRNRPYETDVPDLFEAQPDSIPGPLLPFLKPKHGPSNPLPLHILADRLEAEASILRATLDIDERTAGHIVYWDGPFGRLNVLQSIQVIGFHEANDFKHISEVLRTVAR
ncbi:DinB family protein [Mycobacterium spongiae]|uniref:DinB-like domain-containing protein n=1 Tax=Mycobacterium spongiae TaxID=886343 RepID=A0A975K057_9MYCO|nr:DinB family protein [Mycobacterium spongiae]QUR67763.1 hypothetical protein F6B93_12210 [Mycobacterium spongiae]